MRSRYVLSVLLIVAFTGCLPAQDITIHRMLTTEECILGYLSVRGQVLCYTLELPYFYNINDMSSVPEGLYTARIREDGRRGWRIELFDVNARQWIQIHIGNYTSDITGCILIGEQVSPNNCMLLRSAAARNTLREHVTPLYSDYLSVLITSSN